MLASLSLKQLCTAGLVARLALPAAAGQQQQGFAKAAAKSNSKQNNKQKKNASKSKSKTKKKSGPKTVTPMNEKDPVMMRVISMFEHKPLQPLNETAEQQQANRAVAQEYARKKLAQHVAWQKDMKLKLQLKQAALAALPVELQAAARQEDLTPFPAARSYLYVTPPEAYRD